MAHHMDTARIVLMGSQPRDYIRCVTGATHAGCFLSDALETRSDGLNSGPT